MEPTHWTPEHGPARNPIEQFAHHVWRNRMIWYIAIIVTVSLGLQLGVDGTR